MVECVALESKSHVSSTLSKIDISIVEPLNVFQTNDLKPDCIKESGLDSPTNNILKIVLPLVSENVPMKCQLNTIKCNELFSNENCVILSNNHVQYSPDDCSNVTDRFNKNVNNRNHSLPEDSELNRFSSTFENIKTLLKEGLVDGLDEKPPDFQPPNPPLLYRVSSLPNLLSHDSTKNHNSCSYLTMCGTKQDLIMNKLCKNIVPKHDMSVQVSTELFKNQNEKILVDTSCQTEDIFIETQINTIMLNKDTNHNVDHASINIINNKHEMKISKDNEIINNINDCANISYTNIDICKTECGIKTNGEDCTSLNYTNLDILNKDYEVITNEEDCTSVGYININTFDEEIVNTNGKDSISNVSYTNITTFSKECENNSINENITHNDFKNINDNVDDINEVNGNEELFLHNGYNNIDLFDKQFNTENKGEDCVDIGYTNFSLYDKGMDSNDDCENYANANILEEFVNEQLSLNNIDGDFDSFLFGPLPPSPIEEIGKIFYSYLYCSFVIISYI